jgi:hypothetical protein
MQVKILDLYKYLKNTRNGVYIFNEKLNMKLTQCFRLESLHTYQTMLEECPNEKESHKAQVL